MKKFFSALGLAAVTLSAAGVHAQSNELPSEQEIQQTIKALPPQKRAELAKQLKQGIDQQYQQACDKISANIIPMVMFMGQAGADKATIKSKINQSNEGTPGLKVYFSDYIDFLFKVKADDQSELLHKSRDWCVNRINAKGGLEYLTTLVPQSDLPDVHKIIVMQKAANQ